MAEEQGLPIPEVIKEAPELLPGLEIYYKAFHRLSTTRSFGMSMGPIPWDKVEMYCVAMGYSPDAKDSVHYMISSMDGAYMDKINKKD